ncbi:hypothetical protein [Pseudobacteriovorax antillogorgiicola]|uniref:Uncharacterized protein n=1 Tax=Pseudobacteriovorax antillogorgiicola TaxID=1513793 RepID=A0A1Y6BGQ2_9BACT|nr:hypothetical protein [Pseudobacteriovorax antillogorgiicola]TCS57285.1 hypothetical protein EDD56_10325 [Pseudobacteriovorax antillogorgiicola]SMF03072.1 hypothetical protein SAMN06296036_103308 [Pseudobacteriovorax antillogorgiicola]
MNMKKMRIAGFTTDEIKQIMERIKFRCSNRVHLEDRNEKRDMIWSFAEINILDPEGEERSIHLYDVAHSGVGLIGELQFEEGDRFCFVDPKTGKHYDFVVRHSELFDTTEPGLYQTGGQLVPQKQEAIDVHDIFKPYDTEPRPSWVPDDFES